jgi:hypothetical protein
MLPPRSDARNVWWRRLVRAVVEGLAATSGMVVPDPRVDYAARPGPRQDAVPAAGQPADASSSAAAAARAAATEARSWSIRPERLRPS